MPPISVGTMPRRVRSNSAKPNWHSSCFRARLRADCVRFAGLCTLPQSLKCKVGTQAAQVRFNFEMPIHRLSQNLASPRSVDHIAFLFLQIALTFQIPVDPRPPIERLVFHGFNEA